MTCRRAPDDDSGMTSVVEFLSAFVLFLVILTAFFSLAQLRVGIYEPDVDTTDRASIRALQRLTESEGYFIPLDNDGDLDAVNATTDWHTISANDLSRGHVRPGLGDGAGGLDASRIQGFSNLTPEVVNTGLGIPDEFTVNICITVSDSNDAARVGVQLFCSGALLDLSKVGSSSQRRLSMGGEEVQVNVGVFDGDMEIGTLMISEVYTSPTGGGPEWVELHNSGSFARSLAPYGFGVEISGGNFLGGLLDENEVVPGGGRVIITAAEGSFDWGGASNVIDVGVSGWLAFGSESRLDREGAVRLTHSDFGSLELREIHLVEWDETAELLVEASLVPVDPNSPRGEWTINNSPSPGGP